MDLLVGSWNVRSLVEGSGDACICRSRPMNVVGSEVVDSKVDLLVKELKRYRICVAGIQETKWFGKDVWPTADRCTFLYSGRPRLRGMLLHTEGRVLGFFLIVWLLRHGDELVKCGRQVMLTGCGSTCHDSKRTPLNVTVVCVCTNCCCSSWSTIKV